MFSKKLITALLLAITVVSPTLPAVSQTTSNYVSNRAPLAKTAFMPLPLGSIKAKGWLLKQLELQKEGLTGHAESVYPELGANSAWLGGNAPDSDWERPTYYTRGLIPLAYTLGDQALIAKAKKWMDAVIKSQRPDGSFGPSSNGDWWARMPVITAIEDYYEATRDKRVIVFLQNYFKYQYEKTPEGLGYWGAARAADNIQAVVWLYNRTGDKNLPLLMDKIRKITEDWTTALLTGSMGDSHGVNVAEGFKMPPVWYQRSLDARDMNAFMAGQENAMRLHGQPHDLPSCTEFMAGKSSLQGVELCSIVDRIWSDGLAMMILGDARIGDVTEKIAFNALPGGTSRNMHQHQYYVIPNQAQNVYGPKGIFGQDYENALCPSTRSGVPCCCFNWHMGWPKLTQYTWAATPDGGLSALVYAPTTVSAAVGNGVAVKFSEETNYPFEEQIKMVFSSSKTVTFPLKLRIPGWCRKPVIKVNGVVQTGSSKDMFCTISRTWKNGDTVTLYFPMEIKTTNQINGSVAVERGPIVYSLKMGEEWTKRVPMTVDGMDFSEYEVKPTTAWNYGLVIDQNNPAASIEVNKRPMPTNPFIRDDAPITLSVKAKRIPTWTMAKNGLPQEVPQGPIDPATDVETVTLVPFGSENLRMTYFPVISAAKPARGLTGEYFNGTDFKDLKTTRTDPDANFHWAMAAPDTAVQPDKFCVRWTGQIRPKQSGSLMIHPDSDGDARLWVDGQLAFRDNQTTPITNLKAGKWYDIKLEFVKVTDMADVVLYWKTSENQWEAVPSVSLRPSEASGLEVHYSFDENAGNTAFDSSGNVRNVKLPAGISRRNGKNGGCIVFGGVSDGVTLPSIPGCRDITIAAWVRMAKLPEMAAPIVSGQGTPAVYVQKDGSIAFSPRNSMEDMMPGSKIRVQSKSWFSTAEITAGTWRHVAVVFSAADKTASIYVDGMLDTKAPCLYDSALKLGELQLGGGMAGHGTLSAEIDGFRVYSRALSASEVAQVAGPMPTRGLRAEFYSDNTFGKPDDVAFVPSVDLGRDSLPEKGGAANVRFVGRIVPRYSEDYSLSVASLGGIRMWVDGKKLIDNPTAHDTETSTATIKLEAGRSYELKLDYCSKPDAAFASMRWSSPSQKEEVVPPSCLYPPADAPTPTVAWYDFGESTTKQVGDSSASKMDATTNGTCRWQPGKLLSSLEFARDGYMTLPEGIVKGCKAVTVASWVKLNSGRGWARLFDFGDGPMVNMFLSTSAGPGIRFAITKTRTRGEQRIDAPVKLPIGEWRHIALTLDGKIGIIYVDGVEVGRSSNITLCPADLGLTKQNYIGKSQYGDATLDGSVADFRIYNWALAPENIAAICKDAPDSRK